MKILMVSSYLPYPLYSGGQVRLYNLIKKLSSQHEITLVCEKRLNQTEQDVNEVEKICKKVVTVDRRKQWSPGNILKSGVSAHSFLVTGHTHPIMLQKIKEELDANSFDLIHVETFYVMQNLPSTTVPIVLVEHNIEYKVYGRFLQRVPYFLRPMLAIDIAKIRREEEDFWKKADALVAVSNEDKHVMEEAGFKPALVSNGVNTEQFGFKDRSAFAKASVSYAPELQRRSADKGKRILFIGDFKWIQNRDSAAFIIKEIWPELEARIRKQESRLNVKLWIVARSIPESIKSLASDPNILFDEESSTKLTHEIFQEASVLLAPIRVGGGTSYKILESMSCGTPVITMKLSADALEATDGKELLVGQTAEELAEKTLHILQNEEIYERISKHGRSFVLEHYTWNKIARKLEDVYNSVKK